MTEKSVGILRCLRCRGIHLDRSGREPYRMICRDCGQHYHVVMQLVPVDSDDRPLQLEAGVAEQGS